MFIGYVRVSKADGSQNIDLQKDALIEHGVDTKYIYQDCMNGQKDDRPGLNAALKALRTGDTLVVWKLDRLGRNLKHLISIVQDLSERNISLKVLSGQGAFIDTSTPHGKFIFSMFAALAEFERELIIERTKEGLRSARARGRVGGAPFKMTPAKIRLAAASMKDLNTNVSDLCKELKISRQTLYRHVSPNGELREDGKKLLKIKKG